MRNNNFRYIFQAIMYSDSAMSENYTCDELKRMSELYLATNETCSDRWYNILRKYSFATEGVALFTVACVGVLANMLSIATLGQRTMKSKISALLITLAVFDIVFLLCTFPVFTVQSVNAFVAYLNECHYNGDQSKSAMHSAQSFFVVYTKTFSTHYHLQVQASPKKNVQKKTMLFLASMGETGLCHDIFF